jgi:branched-chain amino acid transport system permease protein
MKGKIALLVALVLCFLVSHYMAGPGSSSAAMEFWDSIGIGSYGRRILVYVGINIVLAVGFNLVMGYTGQFSLGHAGFMAIGAYTSAAFSLFVTRPFIAESGAKWAAQPLFFVAIILGALAAALAGFLVGMPSLRLKGDYLAIVTLGFGEIIRVIFTRTPALGGAIGLVGIPKYSDPFWALGFGCLTIYIVTALVNSVYGSGFLATRDDEVAAEAMGVNTTKYKVIAFVLSAAFAGIAGALFAHDIRSISPGGFDFQKSVEIVVMVIFGGLGNVVGVVFAAVFLTYLNEWLSDAQEWRMVIYALLLIVVMILRPGGLLGTPAEIRRLLAKFGLGRKKAAAPPPPEGGPSPS